MTNRYLAPSGYTTQTASRANSDDGNCLDQCATDCTELCGRKQEQPGPNAEFHYPDAGPVDDRYLGVQREESRHDPMRFGRTERNPGEYMAGARSGYQSPASSTDRPGGPSAAPLDIPHRGGAGGGGGGGDRDGSRYRQRVSPGTSGAQQQYYQAQGMYWPVGSQDSGGYQGAEQMYYGSASSGGGQSINYGSVGSRGSGHRGRSGRHESKRSHR